MRRSLVLVNGHSPPLPPRDRVAGLIIAITYWDRGHGYAEVLHRYVAKEKKGSVPI